MKRNTNKKTNKSKSNNKTFNSKDKKNTLKKTEIITKHEFVQVRKRTWKDYTREEKIQIYEKRARGNFAISLTMMCIAIAGFFLFFWLSLYLWQQLPQIKDIKEVVGCFFCSLILPVVTFVVQLVCNTSSIVEYIKYLKLKPENINDKRMFPVWIFTIIGLIFSTAGLAGSIALGCWNIR